MLVILKTSKLFSHIYNKRTFHWLEPSFPLRVFLESFLVTKMYHNPSRMIELKMYFVNKSPYQVFAGFSVENDVIVIPMYICFFVYPLPAPTTPPAMPRLDFFFPSCWDSEYKRDVQLQVIILILPFLFCVCLFL